MDRHNAIQSTLHPGSPTDAKFSMSNWSVNGFLSGARDRISSLASSLATSVDSQSIGTRRRGSWSPAEAAACYYAAQRKQRATAALNTSTNQEQLSSYIYSIENDFSRFTSMSSRNHFSRRSTQSLKTLHTSDLAMSIPIIAPSASQKNKKANNYQTTSFSVVAGKKQCGSLESVDFEDDDDSASTASNSDSEGRGFGSSSSSSSFGSSPDSSSFVRSTSGFISDYDATRSSSTNTPLDERFARALGYHSLDEIELYSELHKMLESRKVTPDASSSVHSEETVSASSGRRGCSKSVTRFGLGYEDHCMFPLVLPVFLNECLQKKNGSFVTWDYIKLQADAELCRAEYASLQNLSRRFHMAPITGRPIDNVCPDPNLFIRNLCYQLVIEGSFRSMAHREKNRALKRWNSTDDLLSLSSRRKLEPEFIGAKSDTKRSFTDESIALKRTWSIDPRASFRKKNNNNVSLSSCSSPRPGTPNGGSTQLKQSFCSNNLLFKEMSSLVSGSPVKFAQYITRFYLEQFQTGFDVQMLAQLVLVKDISSLDRSKVNRKLRQTLLNLLTFDDTVVAVIGAYFRRQTTLETQARALASMIETACLLRQLRNFYGLNVLVGSLQSLPVYSMTQAWRHLAYQMPVHYRDFKRLCALTRRLDHSILGTNKPHIPTLPNLLNRLRLCCCVSWDLFEAKRRFVEHPSLAGWLHTEMIGGPMVRSCSDFKLTLREQFINPPLVARLSYDPISESYLTTTDPIRLINWSDFPANWSGRYVPAIPERYLRNLLQTKSFASMVECFFRGPIDHYQLANV